MRELGTYAWRLRGQLSEDEDLMPSIAAQLPASWVAVEDRLVRLAAPIVDVSLVVAQSAHGLSEGGSKHLLHYLHDVGSLLFFSRHAALRHVVFPSSSFVINVFKAVFRHDHDRLCYEQRFRVEGITRQQFSEMREDLVQNATARIPMLRALWSEFHLSAEQYLEVFVRRFLSFDFAYLATSSDDVARTLSEELRQRGLTIHSNSVSDLQSSATGGSTTLSGGQTEDMGTIPESNDGRVIEGNLISVLERKHVGLLLPWLLIRDEEPPEAGHPWPTCCETDVVQASVRYTHSRTMFRQACLSDCLLAVIATQISSTTGGADCFYAMAR